MGRELESYMVGWLVGWLGEWKRQAKLCMVLGHKETVKSYRRQRRKKDRERVDGIK